jgi:AcrR family transcriptional regulator
MSLPITVPSSLPRPQQQRSRETLQRILDAFIATLDESDFEAITVQDLCSRAGCSIGSFYGRVESKDGLLEHLRERLFSEAAVELARVFDPQATAQLSFDDALADQALRLVELHVRWRGSMRALIVQARRRADFAAHNRTFNAGLLRLVQAAWLPRAAEMAHPQPERAVETAVLAGAGYLREAIVFGELWPERTPLDAHAQADELRRVWCGALGVGATTSPRTRETTLGSRRTSSTRPSKPGDAKSRS